MSRLDLILIDDDPVDRRVVKRKLRGQGWHGHFREYDNAVQALADLRNARSRKACVIMLDINMPKMSGFEFLAELRADPAIAGTVVFMLTSSDDPGDIGAAFDHCVAGYMTKESLAPGYEKLAELLKSYEAATTW